MDRAALCIRGRGLLAFVEKRGVDECEKLGCDENFPSRLWEGGQADVKYRESPLASVTVRGTCPGTCHGEWTRGWGFPPAWGNEEVIIVAPFT